MKRLLSLILAALLALVSVASPAQAQYADDGVPVAYVDMDGFIQNADRLPWENAQAPPDLLALSPTIHTRPNWVFWNPPLSFQNDLITTIVPQHSQGSGTPTFTRASTAYQQDFEGLYHLVPSGAARMQGARLVWNVFASTEVIDGSWTAINCTTVNLGSGLIQVTSTAPNARFGAGTTGMTGLAFSAVVVASAKVYTSASDAVLRVFEGGTGVHTDITIDNSGVSKRYAVTRTLSVNTVTIVETELFLPTSGTVAYYQYPQLENVTGQANQNPSEYVSVGVLSAPYQGANADGVQYFSTLNGNTVSSNVVTEATGAHIDSSQAATAGGVTAGVVDATGPKGLITEATNTQLVPTADVSDMTQAAWAKVTMTTAFTSTGPDGTANSATRLTASGANATALHLLVAGASSRTASVLIKRITGTGTVKLIQNTTKSADLAASINNTSYTLVQLNANVDVTLLGYGIELGTSGDAVDVALWNFEAGAIASSRMNVVGARPAEVEQYVSAGNLSATAMTIAMEITPSTALGSATVFHFGTYVDASNYTAILSDGTNLIARKRIVGANTDATVAFTRTVGTAVKAVARFDTTNGIDVWLGGTKGTGSATLTASQIGTNFQIGGDGNGSGQDYMEHRNFRVWLGPLSDAQAAVQSAFNIHDIMLPQVAWLDAANDDEYRKRANSR